MVDEIIPNQIYDIISAEFLDPELHEMVKTNMLLFRKLTMVIVHYIGDTHQMTMAEHLSYNWHERIVIYIRQFCVKHLKHISILSITQFGEIG